MGANWTRQHGNRVMQHLDDQPRTRPFRLNRRRCRCDDEALDSRASITTRDESDAYCGYCEMCGRPGHRRSFPGVLPFEGAWCDEHYDQMAQFHPCGRHGVVYWSAAGWFVLVAVACLTM